MENVESLYPEIIRQLPKGIFLSAGDNLITLGWGTFGVVWQKPCCTVYIRRSRFSHDLVEESGRFTLSVPFEGTMKKELAFCGTRSGRDCDKWAETGLARRPASAEGYPDAVAGCAIYLECRVLEHALMRPEKLDGAVRSRFYGPDQATPDGDFHDIYVAEIVSAVRG